ncbi:MAG: class I SAM-dependent methyltransferase [Pirellulales bacterium]
MRKIVDHLPKSDLAPSGANVAASMSAFEPAAASSTRPPTAWQRKARAIIDDAFGKLRYGRLTWRDGDDVRSYGPAVEPPHPLGPLGAATVDILDPRLYADLLIGGSMAAGETYIRGLWRTDDLPGMLRTMLRNQAITDDWDADESFVRRTARRIAHALRGNSIKNSRKNIAAHYDLGNDFYELWLDETMAYSSAVYESPEMTLADAQCAKFDRLCRKLELGSDDHLLEIGTGWGGLAIHAAERYGCRVTTTTISQAQYDHATAQVSARARRSRKRVASGLPCARRRLRQVDLGGNARSGRLSLFRRLFPQVRRVVEARRQVRAANDHHRGPAFRDLSQVRRFHSKVRVSRRVFAQPDRAHRVADAFVAVARDGVRGPGAALRPNVVRVAHAILGSGRRGPRVGVPRAVFADVGLLSRVLRSRLSRTCERTGASDDRISRSSIAVIGLVERGPLCA